MNLDPVTSTIAPRARCPSPCRAISGPGRRRRRCRHGPEASRKPLQRQGSGAISPVFERWTEWRSGSRRRPGSLEPSAGLLALGRIAKPAVGVADRDRLGEHAGRAGIPHRLDDGDVQPKRGTGREIAASAREGRPLPTSSTSTTMLRTGLPSASARAEARYRDRFRRGRSVPPTSSRAVEDAQAPVRLRHRLGIDLAAGRFRAARRSWKWKALAWRRRPPRRLAVEDA